MAGPADLALAAQGMPVDCHLTCAQIFMPFYSDCNDMLMELLDNDISQFTALDQDCSATSTTELWEALADLQVCTPSVPCIRSVCVSLAWR
jgi:hypothetical protein